MNDDQIMAEMVEKSRRDQEIAATLDPNLPEITRYIMAGDIRTSIDALAALRRHEITYGQALAYSGSYGRMNTLMAMMEERLIDEQTAFDILPQTWRSSDPDDTDPRYVGLWYRAFARKGAVVTDGKDLPKGERLTVWRGQRKGDPLGCAWSLKREVAEAFARGASFRTAVANPQLIEMNVPRGAILAYISGRGEEEVIIDPRDLRV